MGAVMDSYEQWTRSEIARLRAEALKASADADALQRSFDRWLESQGRPSEPREHHVKTAENQSLNGHSQRRPKKPAYGDKNNTALAKIKAASPSGGLTTNELYSIFAEIYGPKYKRNSLRALLWHQKGLGNIENRGGRYVIAGKEPGT